MISEDLDRVLEWRNRPEVRNNMYTNHVISKDEHASWFASSSRDHSKLLLMCVNENDQAAGVVTFSNIDRASRTATWAFYSGDTSRRGVGSAMEILALDYAFGQLGLEKLNCEVLEFNMPVVEFHRKHGFRVEGILRSHYEREGRRYDVYRLAQFRQAWQEYVRPALTVSDRSSAKFKAGVEYRARVVISKELVRMYADVSGDQNEIHLNDASAQEAGFKGAIAQGMLVAAGYSKMLGTEFPGQGTVYVSQTLKFARPVYVGSELEYVLRILSRIGSRAIISTRAMDESGQVVLDGEAEIVMPRGIA